MPSAGFEPAILKIKGMLTYALDSIATGIGPKSLLASKTLFSAVLLHFSLFIYLHHCDFLHPTCVTIRSKITRRPRN